MTRQRKIQLLVGLSVASVAMIFALPVYRQSASYHNFADKRSLWCISNAFNVLSNIPFVLVGSVGLIGAKGQHRDGAITWIFRTLFLGVILTGVGSAIYHWRPNNGTLVWDRIPMTLVFMSLLSGSVAELIDRRWGLLLFVPLLVIGVASVWFWHLGDLRGNGDLRLYGWVQYYPVIFLPVIIVLFYKPGMRGEIRALGWVVFWYVIAKICEFLDHPLYGLVDISGHTLKHLAASVSTWYLVVMYRRKYSGSNSVKVDIAAGIQKVSV